MNDAIMTRSLKIAFHAPLKPPDHPIPSGDRQMARMLLAALRRAGHDAFLASRLISYSKRHGQEHMEARKQAAREEAVRLVAQWRGEGTMPDLWFCYHPYDKSPDWLGMEIRALTGMPIITAEPCRTGQGPNGEWLPWRAEAQRGIRQAIMNIVMTNSDMEYVSGFIAPERIAWLDPFIDTALLETTPASAGEWPAPLGESGGEPDGTCRLLSVGMMRPGAKADSYQVLANALLSIAELPWSLVIAGGGPQRGEIEAMFGRLVGPKVRFLGEMAPETVLGLMQQADVLAWPGCREAYGMVYLEAATKGTPAVALDTMGVPLVVQHERTGLLADPSDPGAYAGALASMITDPSLRRRLGEGAKNFALAERSGEQAAQKLARILERAMAESLEA